ncbi:MAG: uracil-DNA glycosylase [Verrucomicrobiota bacterium]|nr:uracil-DNA glycosylase [Verrucomicrobiota bacterium]
MHQRDRPCCQPSFTKLEGVVVECRKCPRLVHYRETVPPKQPYQNECYWRKPVPGFGDPHASLMIIGLAPASHGGNRTGRIFTGDRSAEFLFRSLYSVGLANQPTSISRDDGLKLHNLYITAAVKCSPPQDKPTKEEILECHHYLRNEIALLKNLKRIIVFGKIAFDAFRLFAKEEGVSMRNMRFCFGARYLLPRLPTLYVSYHPSPRNTQTGRLTQEMLTSLLYNAMENIDHDLG